MTKPVALANETYGRLKRRKRPGESFSRTIDRLLQNQRKDPMIFAEQVPRSTIPAKRRLADIERDRESSWEAA